MKMKLFLVMLAIALVAGAVQANLLKNPSFEDGVFAPKNVPAYWIKSYSSYTSAWTWFDDAAGAHSGSKYIKMVSFVTSASSAWIEQTVNVTPGQEYAFSAWAKCPILGETSEAWGYYDFLDSGGAIIVGGWLPWGWDVGRDWTYTEFGTATAPAAATQAIYWLSGVIENGPMGVLFDDAYMGPAAAMFPSPAWEAKVPIGDVELSWTNMDPNIPGDPVYIDVYFGADPNAWSQVVNAGANITSVMVSAPVEDTYYWRVDSYIYGSATGDPIEGLMWDFDVLADVPPYSVDAGADMITWSGQSVQLDATVDDDGMSELTYSWSSDNPIGTEVLFSATDIEDPIVTITNVPSSEAGIVNPSFEDGLTGWDQEGSGHGTWDGSYTGKQYIIPTDGDWLAYVDGTRGDPNEGGWLSQTLTQTLTADTTYTLTVDVANVGYYDEDVKYKVQLLAGGVVVAEDDDSYPLDDYGVWETSTVIHTSGSDAVSDPNLGQPLEIRLVTKVTTEEMSFDNVHFAADPSFSAPEISTVELTVAVNDESDPNPVIDRMTIDVYSDICEATVAGIGADYPSDIDDDCITTLADLAVMVSEWLNDNRLTEPVPK